MSSVKIRLDPIGFKSSVTVNGEELSCSVVDVHTDVKGMTTATLTVRPDVVETVLPSGSVEVKVVDPFTGDVLATHGQIPDRVPRPGEGCVRRAGGRQALRGYMSARPGYTDEQLEELAATIIIETADRRIVIVADDIGLEWGLEDITRPDDTALRMKTAEPLTLTLRGVRSANIE